MAQKHFDEIAPTFCEINRGPLHDYILSLRDPYVIVLAPSSHSKTHTYTHHSNSERRYITPEETEKRIRDAMEMWTCSEKSIGLDASTYAHAVFALGTKFVHLAEQEDSKALLVSQSIAFFERGIETTSKHDKLHHSKLCTNALQLCRKAKYEHEFASRVVDAMKDRDMSYTSADINALMEMAAARGDGDSLYELWNQVLEREDLSPHPFQLDSIVRFESASKPVDELEELMLSYFKKYNIRPPMRSLEYIQDLASDSTSNSSSKESYNRCDKNPCNEVRTLGGFSRWNSKCKGFQW